jgi:cytoskeletal protein RodZ
MAKTRKTSRRFFKPLPLLLALIVVGLAGFGIYRWQHRSGNTATKTPTNPAPHVDLNPPTEEQKNAARDNTTPSTTPTSDSGNKKSVKPEARAYVPGITENGGTCTATFTHGADRVTATSQALANVNYTICQPMRLDGPLNIQGTWTVTVSYSSKTATGTSDSFTFEVN